MLVQLSESGSSENAEQDNAVVLFLDNFIEGRESNIFHCKMTRLLKVLLNFFLSFLDHKQFKLQLLLPLQINLIPGWQLNDIVRTVSQCVISSDHHSHTPSICTNLRKLKSTQMHAETISVIFFDCLYFCWGCLSCTPQH